MVTRRAWLRWLAGACALLGGCVGPPLALGPDALPLATEGDYYEVQLTSDGTADEWTVTDGALPDGLSLDRRTGWITGTPTAPGVFAFTVEAQDVGGTPRAGARDYAIRVRPRLRITLALPAGRVGAPYEAQPAVTGGVPPFSYEVVGLPAGFDYDRATGRVFGTPLNETSGLQVLMVVRDSDAPRQSAEVLTALVIRPLPVEITTLDLPGGRVGQPYSATLGATQGRAPYRWAVVGGVLPDGLRLTTSTGQITGIPTQTQSQTVTIQVTDSDSPPSTATREFTISVQ